MISTNPSVNDNQTRGVRTLTDRVRQIYDIAESDGGTFERDGVKYKDARPNDLRLVYALTTVQARTNNEAMILSMWRVQLLSALMSGKLENPHVGVSRNRRKISEELGEFLHGVFDND